MGVNEVVAADAPLSNFATVAPRRNFAAGEPLRNLTARRAAVAGRLVPPVGQVVVQPAIAVQLGNSFAMSNSADTLGVTVGFIEHGARSASPGGVKVRTDITVAGTARRITGMEDDTDTGTAGLPAALATVVLHTIVLDIGVVTDGPATTAAAGEVTIVGGTVGEKGLRIAAISDLDGDTNLAGDTVNISCTTTAAVSVANSTAALDSRECAVSDLVDPRRSEGRRAESWGRRSCTFFCASRRQSRRKADQRRDHRFHLEAALQSRREQRQRCDQGGIAGLREKAGPGPARRTAPAASEAQGCKSEWPQAGGGSGNGETGRETRREEARGGKTQGGAASGQNRGSAETEDPIDQ